MVRVEPWLSVSVVLWHVLFVGLKTRVNLNDTWLHLRQLSVLADVLRSAWVAGLRVGEKLGADAEVCILSVCVDVLAGVTHVGDRVGAHFASGVS